jgi:hypothetical protein
MRRKTALAALLALSSCALALGSSASGADSDWTGKWKIAFACCSGTMKLTQSGTSISGTYAAAACTQDAVTGIVSGRTVTGTWTESPPHCEGDLESSGRFSWSLSANGRSFAGTWNYASDPTGTVRGPWNGTKAGPDKIELSGTVVEHVCIQGGSVNDPCPDLDLVGAKGRSVAVAGAGGSQRTRTDAAGNYDFDVRKGKHTVTIAGAKDEVKPSSHTVTAESSTSGLDFELCKVPKDYKHRKPGCGVVEIDGKVLDAFGAAYGPFEGHPVKISVPGDDTTTDAAGQFVAFVERGPVTVRAFGYGAFFTEASAVVRATHQVNSATLTLPVSLKITQATTTRVLAQLDGLPVKHDLGLSVDRVPPDGGGSCSSSQSVQPVFPGVSRAEAVAVEPPALFSAFCPGSYTATLSGSGIPVTTDTFTIP